jgi:hypothetical protein
MRGHRVIGYHPERSEGSDGYWVARQGGISPETFLRVEEMPRW